MPSPLSVNVTPDGRALAARVGCGVPVVVKLTGAAALPTVKSAVSGPSTVGATWTTSTEPMSHFAPWGRAMPRWSTEPAPQRVTAAPETALISGVEVPAGTSSRAGLVGPGSRVSVGPPLLASTPSCGSPTTALSEKPQLAPLASVRL